LIYDQNPRLIPRHQSQREKEKSVFKIVKRKGYDNKSLSIDDFNSIFEDEQTLSKVKYEHKDGQIMPVCDNPLAQAVFSDLLNKEE
jgi:hypothetical protein